MTHRGRGGGKPVFHWCDPPDVKTCQPAKLSKKGMRTARKMSTTPARPGGLQGLWGVTLTPASQNWWETSGVMATVLNWENHQHIGLWHDMDGTGMMVMTIHKIMTHTCLHYTEQKKCQQNNFGYIGHV